MIGEFSTILPEIPQGDMDPQKPGTDPNHPCYPFENPDAEKREFYSPGYPAETYPNHTECYLVLRGKFDINLTI